MICLYLYTAAAKEALISAARSASEDEYITTPHLLYALICTKNRDGSPCAAAKLLSAHSITPAAIERHLTFSESRCEASAPPPDLTAAAMTPAVTRILSRAAEEAERFAVQHRRGSAVIGTEHLLFSLLCETDAAAHRLIAACNLPLHELYGDVLSFLSAVAAEEAIFSGITSAQPSGRDTEPAFPQTQTRRSEDEAIQTAPPYLVNMTEEAENGKYDDVVGRERETDAVIRILLHRRKNNPCLLGEAGVGKTAIVEGLAAKIAHGHVPAALAHAQIYAVDLGGMLAGAKYRGEFEERLQKLLQFVRLQHEPIILFIDEVHMLMGAGAAEGAPDAANLLKPALSRGDIRVIGATTGSEFDKTVGRDAAMSRRFQPVHVEEPDTENAYQMLWALRPRLEAHHGVQIPDETLRASVDLSVRCLCTQYLPDKAIDLLDDACAAVRFTEKPPLTAKALRDASLLAGDLMGAAAAVRTGSQTDIPTPPAVTPQAIEQAIQNRTGIVLLSDKERLRRLQTLEKTLQAILPGQTEALHRFADTVRRKWVRLSDRGRPLISLLLTLPPHTDTAALCRTLAGQLFETDNAFHLFDMRMYREAHTVSRLIGAPPGYLGHDDSGLLCAAVRHRPFSLLLFDHIDRAHADVLTALMPMLQHGELTDNRGLRVSFRHTFVIMTVHAEAAARQRLGFTPHSDPVTDTASLPQSFSDLFDDSIRFSRHTDDFTVQKALSDLSSLLHSLSERGITLVYDEETFRCLLAAAHAKDPVGGTRQIIDALEADLAAAILNGSLKDGMTVIANAAADAFVLRFT